MIRFRLQNSPSRLFPLVRTALCLMLACATQVAPAMAALALPSTPDSTLLELRAARRESIRSRALAVEKDGDPALFGLLVVPVEFADTRFPAVWDPLSELAPALSGKPPATLIHYFSVASGGKLEMRTTLTPIIRLSRERAYYSDLGTTYFLRTRLMATETLEALRDLGLDFRRLDMDGPDGIPASGDDDGLVDGVLFLHAGIGLENDLENGLIPAHQFFLTEPVVSGGVGASFYAVASHISGLGIWVHETGHLLGMEDRYDPRLRPAGASEVQSRGGLGRFSLMASGAWGIGGGRQPALPDAYTCLQLGWVRARLLDVQGLETQTIVPGLESGEVGRIWTNGQPGEEFFLVETRDPPATYPFDAAVPGGQLLIYHVDESLPEGYVIEDGSEQEHLRVRLVEADADGGLLAGLDDGHLGDLFPGSGARSSFGPLTDPSSNGYEGPSAVALTQISSLGDRVTLVSSAAQSFAFDCSLAWSPEDPAALALTVQERGEPFTGVQAALSVPDGPAWGSFLAGGLSREFPLLESQPGLWIPAEEVFWVPDPAAPPGAATRFTVRFTGAAWTSGDLVRDWVWSPSPGALDFTTLWPGEWVVERPGPNRKTGWFRWDAAPWLTVSGTPVLACVDTIFPDSSEWPAVRYNNFGQATITSGPLDDSVTGVRLVHAIEGELLTGAVALDGGQVVWVGPDGIEYPTAPVDGWEGRVHDQAYTPLYGQGVLVGNTPLLRNELPVWQTDVFSVPQDGLGPWRLRLVFASDASGYRHGWFVSSIEALFGVPPASAFPIRWQGDPGRPDEGLTWTWPLGEPSARGFLVEGYDPDQNDWYALAERIFDPDPASGEFHLPAAEGLLALSGSDRLRNRIRVVGDSAVGLLASRPVVLFPDGGPDQTAQLGPPWPNPSADGSVRFLAEVPPGQVSLVTIFDLRGRQIQSWSLPSGNHFLLWKGTAADGRRVAAGTYFLRLTGSGLDSTYKVVLLH